jgi:SAM-dependent methyltransferase
VASEVFLYSVGVMAEDGTRISEPDYLMEHPTEAMRLRAKTREDSVRRQAAWAGLEPGMRVVDIGCGPGVTTNVLHEMVQPGGYAVGVDASSERLRVAQAGFPDIAFRRQDVRLPMNGLGEFDFVWVRFVLEFFRSQAFDIVRNLRDLLAPGGILLLIDLDYNSLTHYELPSDLAAALASAVRHLEEHCNWDPYMGRRLYSYLYDLGLSDIRVDLEAHHLFYGPIDSLTEMNWTQKLNVALRGSGYQFPELEGGIDEFGRRMKAFLRDPRRFTYTPLVLCCGVNAEGRS